MIADTTAPAAVGPTSRRALMGALAVTTAATDAPAPAGAGEEPIFAAIAEYRTAIAARAAAIDQVFAGLLPDDHESTWGDREFAAMAVLQDTVPTTVAGAAALLALYGERHSYNGRSVIQFFLEAPTEDQDDPVAKQLTAIAALLRSAV